MALPPAGPGSMAWTKAWVMPGTPCSTRGRPSSKTPTTGTAPSRACTAWAMRATSWTCSTGRAASSMSPGFSAYAPSPTQTQTTTAAAAASCSAVGASAQMTWVGG